MKYLSLALFLAVFALWTPAEAKSPTDDLPRPSVGISPGELAPTPEMWFYEQQMRQYQDPKQAVRQKAEFRSAERQRRLTAMKWYGFSNARPRAGVDSIHSDYAPQWTSGNWYQPLRWPGTTGSTLVVPSK